MWPVCEVRMTVVRADRLVAILLLLQAKGQVTAGEVAAELEVCERTARRDLEALGMAGVPVYSGQGRNGGWQLVGGARTDLSGLTAAEARALFLVAGPSSSATPEVKAALRKLARALPETFRSEAEAASTAVIIDTRVGPSPLLGPAPPHLDALQHAVIEGEQLVLGYVARDQARRAPCRCIRSGSRRRAAVVPRRRHRSGASHVPRRPGASVAHRRSRRASRRLRPRGVVAARQRRGRPAPRPAACERLLVSGEVVWDLRHMFGTRVRIGDATPDGRGPSRAAGR